MGRFRRTISSEPLRLAFAGTRPLSSPPPRTRPIPASLRDIPLPFQGSSAIDRSHQQSSSDHTEETIDSAPFIWRGLQLNDFQRQAVAALESGDNLLVGAPTGAGKTLVAEYAIEQAVKRGKRAVFTAPIKALSNQKYRDFRPDFDTGLLTGDVTLNPNAQILVMTTEILRNAIFENPDYLRDVEVVVFDEIHYLDDPDRGTVWEESLIFAPPEVRFICLSATIQNIDELGAWIDEIRPQALSVVLSNLRPVPLKHMIFTDGQVREMGELKGLRQSAKRKAERNKHSKRGRNNKGKHGRHGKHNHRGRRPGPENPGPLFDQLQEDRQLPALVFCFSRKECERGARRNGKRDLLSTQEKKRVANLIRDLKDTFRLEEEPEVLGLARHGVAFHHAGMLPVEKELVERLFTSSLIKMLFTTETFALGINMPARAVVFPSLRKFDGESVDWLRTRDYMQMAGRAGRQGLDKFGAVYSLLSGDEVLTAPMDRLSSGKPEPVVSRFRLSYSSLLHLVEWAGAERISEAWEKSFNQFQHRDTRPGARERNRKRQQKTVGARLKVLRRLGYLDEHDEHTARGRVARHLPGFEIPVTEMLFEGLLEDLPPRALGMVFVAQIHAERRPDRRPYVPARIFGELRDRIDRLMRRLSILEFECGSQHHSKAPDWGLSAALMAWYEGADLDQATELCQSSAGDLCRTFRMAIQLMRQVRRAIDPSWELSEGLASAMASLNRGEIDARKQLELSETIGDPGPSEEPPRAQSPGSQPS